MCFVDVCENALGYKTKHLMTYRISNFACLVRFIAFLFYFCRSAATKFLCNLSYNDQTRPFVLKSGVLEPLVQAMEVNDEETWPISAALAVACLVEGQHPALERGCHKKILSDLVTALEAALCGWDFPRGTGGFPTDFKMMMGVQMLCKTKVNCAYLLECGVMRLIRCALDNTEASDILHRYSLLALWAIIAHQS
eukprot:c18685_g1_i5.p1 GENE.c18685_g1_i5~~c18685_g1_i5.p1  ORF type:complete len:195 (+),score=33.78 c18685_g1_i5:605-1189(+)